MNYLGNLQKAAIKTISLLIIVLIFPFIVCHHYYSDINGRLIEGATYKSSQGTYTCKLQRTGSTVHVMKYDTDSGVTMSAGSYLLSDNKLVKPSGERVGKIKSRRDGSVITVHLSDKFTSYSGYYTKM